MGTAGESVSEERALQAPVGKAERRHFLDCKPILLEGSRKPVDGVRAGMEVEKEERTESVPPFYVC